nr:hypothetical protein [Tanacetum cinerariifolium]
MTKVVKGEFEKLKNLRVEDVMLTYDTSLMVFNNEFHRMSKMDDNLFTYEIEVANIPSDSNKDDDSKQRTWREDGYCDGENLPVAYHIGNSLYYQDLECNDDRRRWESHEITYHDHDEIKYENETHDERQGLSKAHELSVCNIRKFKMIKYSFGQDEEYVAVKEDEYEDLARTSDDACRAYQEIFRRMDKGLMVTRAE